MKNVKKIIKEYYNKNYDHDDNIDLIKEKANINNNKKKGLLLFMKTKKLAIISTALFIITVSAIVIGCTLNSNQTNQQNEPIVTNAVITLDLNPSIQLTVDEKGIVASVYGANDDGKMIIVDVEDEIIGKTYNEAIDKILEIETDCGFFVKYTTSDEYNNLTITIDAEATQNKISEIETEIKAHVEEKLTELGIKVEDKITTIKNNTKESLINKLLSLDSTLNIEELNELSHKELINLIAAYHIERINLPTTAIEEMYNSFKEYEINIAETKIFKNFITSSSNLSNEIIQNYDQLQLTVENGLVILKQKYNEIFIEEDSMYNKALLEVSNLKSEILNLQNEIAKLEDGLEKSIKLAQLTALETTLSTAETALELTKESANSALELVATSLTEALNSLKEYIYQNSDLNSLMTEKANELSEVLNNEKKEFITKFETEYKDQIEEKYNNLLEQKANLIDKLKEQN